MCFSFFQLYFDDYQIFWAFPRILYVVLYFSDVFAWVFDGLDVFSDLGTNTHQTLLLVFGGFNYFVVQY